MRVQRADGSLLTAIQQSVTNTDSGFNINSTSGLSVGELTAALPAPQPLAPCAAVDTMNGNNLQSFMGTAAVMAAFNASMNPDGFVLRIAGTTSNT